MTKWTWIISAVGIVWTAVFAHLELAPFAILTCGFTAALWVDAVCRAVLESPVVVVESPRGKVAETDRPIRRFKP